MSLMRPAIAFLKKTGLEMTATELAGISLERGPVESNQGTCGATPAAPLCLYVRDPPLVRSARSPSPESPVLDEAA
jgi:hypothetical protein